MPAGPRAPGFVKLLGGDRRPGASESQRGSRDTQDLEGDGRLGDARAHANGLAVSLCAQRRGRVTGLQRNQLEGSATHASPETAMPC